MEILQISYHSFKPAITLQLLVLLTNNLLSSTTSIDVAPTWNVTAIQNNYSQPCSLAMETINGQNMTILSAHGATCTVHITSETGVIIEIHPYTPDDSFLYVEKTGDLMDCQNRYVDVAPPPQAPNETCFIVLADTKLQLFLQGNTSILISDATIHQSPLMCLQESNGSNIDESELSEGICRANEFKSIVSCSVFINNICILDFPYQCNAILGNRQVELNCSDISNHRALINYPNEVRSLEISHQNVKEIARHAFINLKQLYELDLSYNGLSSIHPKAFSGLNLLNVLDLRDNKLQNLHTDTFDGLVNLEILRLDDNQLYSLDSDLFHDAKKLFKLYLHYNMLTVLPMGLLRGMTNLVKLTLVRNQLVSIDADLFQDTTSLVQLFAQENNLTSLPEGSFKGLANLQTLVLNTNQIRSLDVDLFNETTSLVQLHLHENQISSIDAGTFNETKSLVYLFLQDNLIGSIGENSFDATKYLIRLYLHNNNLTTLPIGLFDQLVNVQILTLSNNMLTSLDTGVFSGTINLRDLYLQQNLLTIIHEDVFNRTRGLSQVYLYENRLEELPTQLFRGLYYMHTLFLTKNRLHTIAQDNEIFQDMRYLQVLTLGNNYMAEVSYDMFWNFTYLRDIDLGYNKLSSLDHMLFKGLMYLNILYLNFNRLRTLDVLLFNDTVNLRLLELSGNELTDFPAVHTLNQLSVLGLAGNKLTLVDKLTFSGLPNEVELFVSPSEVCECYSPQHVNCSSLDVRSPYLTCERLLSDRVLMVMMWLIGINALCGNLFVLSRKKSKSERKKVQTFLLDNLAVFDLLMGVYMLIIASADIYFGEYFPMRAETWRSGITCRIAGAMSIISSEASVFLVTLISIDRFINIRFPFSKRKLKRKFAIVIVILLWCSVLVLGIVPSVLAGRNYKFYETSHVCIGLPLAQIERFSKYFSSEKYFAEGDNHYWFNKYIIRSQSLGHVQGLYYAVAVFLGLNGVSYLLILVCYIEIIRFVSRSSKRAGVNKDMKEQIRLAVKVAAIVLTDFFCWAPVIILGILVQCSLVILPPSVYAWSVTAILPLNSAINPYLYTIAGILSDRRKRARVTPSGNELSSFRSNRSGWSRSVTGQTELPSISAVASENPKGELVANPSSHMIESNV